MSIISIVDKIRSLSIEFNTNQSTNIDHAIPCDYHLVRFLSILIGNTKKRYMAGG